MFKEHYVDDTNTASTRVMGMLKLYIKICILHASLFHSLSIQRSCPFFIFHFRSPSMHFYKRRLFLESFCFKDWLFLCCKLRKMDQSISRVLSPMGAGPYAIGSAAGKVLRIVMKGWAWHTRIKPAPCTTSCDWLGIRECRRGSQTRPGVAIMAVHLSCASPAA